ncbi:MAG: hypothetical protein WD690_10745 [Vicinamibacterales bacterium]
MRAQVLKHPPAPDVQTQKEQGERVADHLFVCLDARVTPRELSRTKREKFPRVAFGDKPNEPFSPLSLCRLLRVISGSRLGHARRGTANMVAAEVRRMARDGNEKAREGEEQDDS